MPMKRVVLEIGMGTDIRGAEPTKAAVRALKDALWHNGSRTQLCCRDNEGAKMAMLGN